MKPKINMKELEVLRKLLFTSDEVKGLLIRTKVLLGLVTLISKSFELDDIKSVVFVDAVPVRGNILSTVVVNCFDPTKTAMERIIIPIIGVVK